MKNSKLYHTLPTIRKIRRMLRRQGKRHTLLAGSSRITARVILRDNADRDVLKTRRWRNRFMTTSKALTK